MAGWGNGYGPGPDQGNRMGYGRNDCPGFGGDTGGAARGSGYGNSLTDDQRKKIDDARQAFFKDTQDLRQQIYEKQMALRAELAKKEPDVAVATGIQKELSRYKGTLDEKRLQHLIEIKKIAPYARQGFLGGGKRGGGPRGGGSGGPCWR